MTQELINEILESVGLGLTKHDKLDQPVEVHRPISLPANEKHNCSNDQPSAIRVRVDDSSVCPRE